MAVEELHPVAQCVLIVAVAVVIVAAIWGFVQILKNLP